MSGQLPKAEFQSPACGVCSDETYSNGDEFVCDSCGLVFNLDDLSASFAAPETPVCGAKCDNYWHGDNKIYPGHGYECGTCLLPSGHATCVHWTGCRLVELSAAAVGAELQAQER